MSTLSPIVFSTTSTQISTSNQEIFIANKPVEYVGLFIASYLCFSNEQDCHVIINNNSNQMFVPAGGFEFNSIYQIQSFIIVESGISFNYSGIVPSSLPVVSPIISGDNNSNIIGLATYPPVVNLASGEQSQIQVTGVRSGMYINIINPSGTVFSSGDINVCTVSNKGLIEYIASGNARITIANGLYYDIIEVSCS